jgi:gag-polypeptide of LTR copia-type
MEDEMVKINYNSIPTFDDTASKFMLWWSKNKAFAMISGFVESIREEPDPMHPSSHDQEIDVKPEDGTKMILAKKRNKMAVSSFTMAFTKEGIMRLASCSKTKEWPDDLAYLVVKELNKKFRPKDIISKFEMRQRLNQVSMKKGSDPALLFETLAAIEDQFSGIGNLEETDLIAIVLDVAPEEYQAVLMSEKSGKGEELTLSDLENVMCQHHRQLNRNKTLRRTERGEVLLTAFA